MPIKGRTPGVPLSDSIGELMDSYFRHGWNVRDERELGIQKMLRTGIMVDQDFMTPEMMKSSPFYNELLIPHGLQWFAGLAFHADDEIWCAALQRAPAQGPFTASDQESLLAIRDHLTAAATLARRFGLARIEGLTAAFNTQDIAFILLDRRGRPVLANMKAEQFIRETLHVVKGEFTLAKKEEQTTLHKQIARVLGCVHDVETPQHLPVIASREGLSPLILHVVALPRKLLGSFAPAIAMILIVDPDERCAIREDVLTAAFGLTRAEASLASCIASGASLADYARRHSLADNTVRGMMKQIFAKSDTHRQGELIALLNRLVRNAPK